MVLNATFNNISAISWLLVLLVVEIEVPGKNHLSVASHWQTLSHICVSSAPRSELITSVVIYTDCTGSWKSNYNTITTTTLQMNQIALIYMSTSLLSTIFQTLVSVYMRMFLVPCSICSNAIDAINIITMLCIFSERTSSLLRNMELIEQECIISLGAREDTAGMVFASYK
jgi:hypothetical protein